MKTTRNILWGLTAFYFAVFVGYTVWTAVIEKEAEWVGIVAFALMSLFSAFIAWYMGLENKPFARNLLPEDREEAEISEADPELGVFAPRSMWPVILAAAIAAVFASICFGWWPVFWFAPIGVVGLLGWMFEFYRGKYAH